MLEGEEGVGRRDDELSGAVSRVRGAGGVEDGDAVEKFRFEGGGEWGEGMHVECVIELADSPEKGGLGYTYIM